MVSRLEDRLIDALGAAAETVRPESAGVLREPTAPARTRRIAPLAAATAVAVIIILASVITPLTLAGGHGTPSRPAGTAHTSPTAQASPRDSTLATVPTVVGMHVLQATALLEAVPLDVTIVYQRSTAVPPGTVSAQTPAGGTRVPFGTTITMTASVPVSSASRGPDLTEAPGTRMVSSSDFAVTITIPSTWTLSPGYGAVAYDGATGWVELNVMAGGYGLQYACSVTANANVLHPYGLHPQITYRNIDGRPGCIIFPSSDAVFWDRRNGGPKFQSAAALVPYQVPLSGGALYLVIEADPGHVVAIADGAQLHQ